MTNVQVDKEQLAIILAYKLHKGQFYGELPYFYHLAWVASRVSNNVLDRIVAFLHDVLEDTDYTEAEMLEEFGETVTNAVVALTRTGLETYKEFIVRAGANPVARRVKLADLECHLAHQPSRGLKKRYEQATQILGDL